MLCISAFDSDQLQMNSDRNRCIRIRRSNRSHKSNASIQYQDNKRLCICRLRRFKGHLHSRFHYWYQESCIRKLPTADDTLQLLFYLYWGRHQNLYLCELQTDQNREAAREGTWGNRGQREKSCNLCKWRLYRRYLLQDLRNQIKQRENNWEDRTYLGRMGKDIRCYRICSSEREKNL